MSTTQNSVQPFARQATLRRSVWFGANLISILADGDDTGGSLAVMEIDALAGSEPLPHTHAFDDEMFYILNGQVEFTIGPETVRASRGDAVFMPRGVEHAYRVLTADLHAVIFTSPAGLEDAFREIGVPARTLEANPSQPSPSPERMKSVFGARGIAFRSADLAALTTRPNPRLARRPSYSRSRWYMGHLMTPLVTSDDSRQFSLVEFKGRAGNEPPQHVHHNEDELYYILDGEVTFDVGGEILHGFPGSLVFLPRGVPHGFKIVSKTARALIGVTPSGFEQYFMEFSTGAESLSIPASVGNVYDVEKLVEAGQRYGFEMVPAENQVILTTAT